MIYALVSVVVIGGIGASVWWWISNQAKPDTAAVHAPAVSAPFAAPIAAPASEPVSPAVKPSEPAPVPDVAAPVPEPAAKFVPVAPKPEPKQEPKHAAVPKPVPKSAPAKPGPHSGTTDRDKQILNNTNKTLDDLLK